MLRHRREGILADSVQSANRDRVQERCGSRRTFHWKRSLVDDATCGVAVRPAHDPLPPDIHYALWILVGLLTISVLGTALRAMRAWPEQGVLKDAENR